MDEEKIFTLHIVAALILILIFYIILYIDSWFDTHLCKTEFVHVSGLRNEFHSVYANDDFWKVNLGRDIRCTVYWRERYFTGVDFISGTLTNSMIESERYWK